MNELEVDDYLLEKCFEIVVFLNIFLFFTCIHVFLLGIEKISVICVLVKQPGNDER